MNAKILPCPRRERGIALIITLVMLVTIMLLAVASMRGVALQERMSGSFNDRNRTFQTVEAALRAGEAQVLAIAVAPATSSCNDGVCGPVPDGAIERWRDPAFTAWGDASADLDGKVTDQIDATPEYVAELVHFADNPDNLQPIGWGSREIRNCLASDANSKGDCMKPAYRVTARAQQETRTSILLQSTVAGR